MKRSKFTESQIIFALRQADTGVKVQEVCLKKGRLQKGEGYTIGWEGNDFNNGYSVRCLKD